MNSPILCTVMAVIGAIGTISFYEITRRWFSEKPKDNSIKPYSSKELVDMFREINPGDNCYFLYSFADNPEVLVVAQEIPATITGDEAFLFPPIIVRDTNLILLTATTIDAIRKVRFLIRGNITKDILYRNSEGGKIITDEFLAQRVRMSMVSNTLFS